MHRRILLATFAAFVLAGAAARAYEPTAEEKKALDDALETWITLYNKHDAKALAMEYSEDADVIVPTGEKIKGRAAYEKALAENFSKNPNVKSTLSEVSRRFLTADIVVEDGAWEDSGLSEAGAPAKGLYTSILVKRDGKWLVVHERAWVPYNGPGTDR